MQTPITLPNRIEIGNPLELIMRYYRENAHDLYDNLEVPQDNQLDLACLSSLAFFETHSPRMEHWRELWLRKSEIESQLNKIPADLPLSGPNIPWKDLKSLFATLLDCSGFSIPRASKILHKKRPHLIPILDRERVILVYYKSVVEQGVRIAMEESMKQGHNLPPNILKLPHVMLELVKSVREDLLNNLDALQRIKNELGSTGNRLSLVRIYDIILWESASPLRN